MGMIYFQPRGEPSGFSLTGAGSRGSEPAFAQVADECRGVEKNGSAPSVFPGEKT
jgi:hypothetical protein